MFRRILALFLGIHVLLASAGVPLLVHHCGDTKQVAFAGFSDEIACCCDEDMENEKDAPTETCATNEKSLLPAQHVGVNDSHEVSNVLHLETSCTIESEETCCFTEFRHEKADFSGHTPAQISIPQPLEVVFFDELSVNISHQNFANQGLAFHFCDSSPPLIHTNIPILNCSLLI